MTDPSGSVIAGAEVAIKNVGTGIVRTVTTDSAGLYSAPNLIPGTYEVTVTATGFSKSVQSNLTLSVGQQQSLNMTMKVGESTQTVTVEGSAPTVELTSATLSAQVNATTVRELPLNGRDWTQLATLQPGVNTVRTQASTSSPTTNRANRGFGNQLTDSGHSPYENSYRVNGININDYTNGSPGSVIGANLGTDAIQEFSVLTTDYTAEYGRTSGAVINSITKSGTNDFHGTAFGFLRNASLDAKNYFDSKSKPIPPFERYQYGGAIGGPIIKDKTFFFAAYEGVEQHRSNTTTVVVPSANAESGFLCSLCPLAQQVHLTPGANTDANGVSLFVKPYLGFWPTPPSTGSTVSSTGDTVSFPTNGLLNLKENYASARVDHHFSDNDTLSGSWMFDRGPYTQPDALLNVTSSLFSFRQMYGVEETHVFSSTLVNTARFGYNRSHGINGGIVGAINPIAADTTLGVRPGIASPIVAFGSGGITPIASVGSASQNLLVSNSFQFYDDAFWTKGTHAFKFGIAVERIQFNATTRQRPNGQFTFSNLQAFLTDVPSKVQELQPGNAYEVGSRNTAFGFYAQDDWKAKPNLSINIGLRYEPVTLPSEASNRFAVLTSLSPSVISNETVTPVQHLWSGNSTLKNFEPRIGFSWDPFKDGKTAIRGGFGMFDILPIPWTYTQTLPAQIPFTLQVTASGLSGPSSTCPNGDFPVVCSKTFGPTSLNVVYVPQNPGRSYAMNWNLNIQRQVTSNLTVTLGYVGSRSIHLPDLPDNINYQLPTLTSAGYLFPANSVGKLDTAVGSMRARLWDNEGWYHGFQLGVTKQLSHGLQLQGSYTWSKCEDTGSNMAFNDPFQNSLPDYFYFDHRLTKGLCDYNISQNGVVSFIYNIPGIGSKTGFTSKVLGGWQVGTIITVQSGSPFTPVIGNDPYLRSQGDTNQGYVDIISGCNPINANWKSAGPGGLHYLNMNCFTLPSVPTSMTAQCTPLVPKGPFVATLLTPPAGQTFCPNAIGDLGRNQIVGPGLFDMDFSVFKNIRITERITTQFRVEMFNVLNHPSFLPPLNNEAIFNFDGSVANNPAVVDTTSTDPRQIQFGLKVNF
ncbi:MAG: carboxypeptidase regulatory-like domain-containing protein [Acidobacteriia bacterium]|nr:carboxypeptidase regulatory-like domain-containing protein [Terriglobia bacterium]